MKKEKWKTFVTDRWKVAKRRDCCVGSFLRSVLFLFMHQVGIMLRTRQNSGLIFYKILKAVLQNFALFLD